MIINSCNLKLALKEVDESNLVDGAQQVKASIPAQPISACPANRPVPRRLASRVAMPKYRQGHDLTPAQGSLRASMDEFQWPLRLAKVVHHHVQCGKLGLNVYHQLAPFLGKFEYANCKILSLFLSTLFYFTPDV